MATCSVTDDEAEAVEQERCGEEQRDEHASAVKVLLLGEQPGGTKCERAHAVNHNLHNLRRRGQRANAHCKIAFQGVSHKK